MTRNNLVITKWEEKHTSLLEEYSKGSKNNEVMKMYRSRMKDVLDIIDDLRSLKESELAATESEELTDILNCIAGFDKDASIEEKGRYFELIQRDIVNYLKTK